MRKTADALKAIMSTIRRGHPALRYYSERQTLEKIALSLMKLLFILKYNKTAIVVTAFRFKRSKTMKGLANTDLSLCVDEKPNFISFAESCNVVKHCGQSRYVISIIPHLSAND